MRAGIYLLRRHRRAISFRCRVPLALVSIVGKREIVRSLRTQNKRLARAMAAGIALHLSELWSQVEGMEHQNEVARLLEAWFRRELARTWRLFDSGELTKNLIAETDDPGDYSADNRAWAGRIAENDLDDLGRDYQGGKYLSGLSAAREVNGDLDSPFGEEEQHFRIIAKEALKAKAAIAESLSHWARGEAEFTPTWTPDLPGKLFPIPVVPAIAPTAASGPSVTLLGKTLREVFELYSREQRLTLKTHKDFATAIRRFTELHGDLDLAMITKGHVVLFKDMLLKLPVRISGPMRGLTAPQIVERLGTDTDTPRISPQTVNNKGLAAISATLGYALRNTTLTTNAASKVVAGGVDRSGKPPVVPYTDQDLAKLFSSPIFEVVPGIRTG